MSRKRNAESDRTNRAKRKKMMAIAAVAFAVLLVLGVCGRYIPHHIIAADPSEFTLDFSNPPSALRAGDSIVLTATLTNRSMFSYDLNRGVELIYIHSLREGEQSYVTTFTSTTYLAAGADYTTQKKLTFSEPGTYTVRAQATFSIGDLEKADGARSYAYLSGDVTVTVT